MTVLTVYLIGALIAFSGALITFKVTRYKVDVGMLLGSIAIGITSWFGVLCLILGVIGMLHSKAIDEGWYDIDLF